MVVEILVTTNPSNMTHIYKLSKECGYAIDSYKVQICKKGINFIRYVSVEKYGWVDAEKKAIKIEQELTKKLSKCKTLDDIYKFYTEWK